MDRFDIETYEDANGTTIQMDDMHSSSADNQRNDDDDADSILEPIFNTPVNTVCYIREGLIRV